MHIQVTVRVGQATDCTYLVLTLHVRCCAFSCAVDQCYSLATIGYRVMTFNDCDEAAAELRKVSIATWYVCVWGRGGGGYMVCVCVCVWGGGGCVCVCVCVCMCVCVCVCVCVCM